MRSHFSYPFVKEFSPRKIVSCTSEGERHDVLSDPRRTQALVPVCSLIRRNAMISKAKLGALALVAMIGIATPTFAQNLETGTAANTYGWNSPQADAISGGPSGLHAFAMVPRAHVRSGLRAFDMVPGAAFGLDSPSATGGGSIGYNSYNGRDS
jgi:hypothetical protein